MSMPFYTFKALAVVETCSYKSFFVSNYISLDAHKPKKTEKMYPNCGTSRSGDCMCSLHLVMLLHELDMLGLL